MAWTCGKCGQKNQVDMPRVCEACGAVVLGVIVLTGESGKEIALRLDADIGKITMRSLAGEEGRFASDPQFRLKKDDALKSWTVIPNKSATNPTVANGAPCPDDTPMPVKSGDTIAIGSRKTPGVEKAKLKITIRYEG
jgi:hypothetical protein